MRTLSWVRLNKKLRSDWPVDCIGDSDCIVGNGPATLLQLASQTVLKLQSDWDSQIPLWVVNWTKLFAQSHQTLSLVPRPHHRTEGKGSGELRLNPWFLLYAPHVLTRPCEAWF